MSRKTALLVGGDLAALLIFIAIGRNNHGESLDIVSVVQTAAPFLIGTSHMSLSSLVFCTEAAMPGQTRLQSV